MKDAKTSMGEGHREDWSGEVQQEKEASKAEFEPSMLFLVLIIYTNARKDGKMIKLLFP